MHVHPHGPLQYPQAFPQQFPQQLRPAPPSRPARRRRPYPASLVRFPWGALPQSRRKRGPSIGRVFYLGRHPIALLIEMLLTAIALEVILGWIALVVLAWAAWAALVTVNWACQVATDGLRR